MALSNKDTRPLNHSNQKWMEYFNDKRDIFAPVASEWERLATEYKRTIV